MLQKAYKDEYLPQSAVYHWHNELQELSLRALSVTNKSTLQVYYCETPIDGTVCPSKHNSQSFWEGFVFESQLIFSEK